jgi:hypothetical protein
VFKRVYFVIPMFKNLLFYLFKVRGLSLVDEIRLRFALVNYIYHLLTRRLKNGHLGFYIPGQNPLTIKTFDGYVFMIKPKTTHLALATLLLE